MENSNYDKVIAVMKPAGRERMREFGRYLGQRARLRRLDQSFSIQRATELTGFDAIALSRWEAQLPLRTFQLERVWEKMLSVPQGWLRDPTMAPVPEGFSADPMFDDVVQAIKGSALVQAELVADEIAQLRAAASSGAGNEIGTPALASFHSAMLAMLPAQVNVLDEQLRGFLGPALSVADVQRFFSTEFGRDFVSIGAGRIGSIALPFGVAYESLLPVYDVAIEMIEMTGAACVSLVAGVVSEREQRAVRTSEIATWCAALPGFEWLEQESGWFWFGPEHKTYVRSLARKLLSVARQRIDIDEFRDAIARDVGQAQALALAGFGAAVPPIGILEEALKRLPEALPVISQHAIRRRVTIAPEEVLSVAEIATLYALQDAGGVATVTTVASIVARRTGRTKVEAAQLLASSPIAVEVGEGVLRLCGWFLDPDAYARAAARRRREIAAVSAPALAA
jgi:hypothetical protein